MIWRSDSKAVRGIRRFTRRESSFRRNRCMNLVPVALSAKDELTSQYTMNDLEKVGMLKMDFLALTTLTIISDCLNSH